MTPARRTSFGNRVLLVEDDQKLGAWLRRELTDAGFDVRWVTRGDEALRFPLEGVALAVLDLGLPGASGMDFLRAARRNADVPIIVLTARRDSRDVVRCLELGADDFVTKPFVFDELLARIEARLRRPVLERRDGEGRVIVDDRLGFVVDPARRSAEVGGADCGLTRVEFDILQALVRRPGAALTRRALVDAVLDPDREGTERTLDVHVSRLRRKLGAARESLETVRGIGYRLRSR